jgi:hypothetical protein
MKKPQYITRLLKGNNNKNQFIITIGTTLVCQIILDDDPTVGNMSMPYWYWAA